MPSRRRPHGAGAPAASTAPTALAALLAAACPSVPRQPRTAAEWRGHTGPVRARRRIHDSPAARQDDGVPAGTLGVIDDLLPDDGDARGLVVVTFAGDRVLLCEPNEIAPVRVTPCA